MSEDFICSYQPQINYALAVAVRTAERPNEEELMQSILAWTLAHVELPLRSSIEEYIKFGGGNLNVLDVSDPSVWQLLQDVRGMDGAPDPLGCQGLRWCIIIGARGLLIPPMLHIWFARIAAHVLSAHYNEPVSDVLRAWTDPRYADPSFMSGGQGYIHVGKHLAFMALPAAPGLARVTSIGMHYFGLPDLEIARCPFDLASSATLLMIGAAQHVLFQVMRAAKQTADGSGEETLTLTLPREFSLPADLIDYAMGVELRTSGPSISLSLAFIPGDALGGGMVHLTGCRAVGYLGDGWVRQAFEKLFPAEPNIVIAAPEDVPPAQLDLAEPECAKTLVEVHEMFINAFDSCATLAVKAPFLKPTGGLEFMWVAVSNWKDEMIGGELMNTSAFDDELVTGTQLNAESDTLTAWRLIQANGQIIGGPIKK